MDQEQHFRTIVALPEYTALLRQRRRVIVPLCIVVLVAYYTFILLVAYRPDLMGQPLHAGTSTSVGLAAGLGLILMTFAITAFYVWYANTRIEPILHALHQKAARHD